MQQLYTDQFMFAYIIFDLENLCISQLSFDFVIKKYNVQKQFRLFYYLIILLHSQVDIILFIQHMGIIKFNWLSAAIFFYVIKLVSSYNKFCPVICSNQGCSDNLTCTGCMSPWTWNATASACQLLATSGWSLVDTSQDLGGFISSNFTSPATCSCTGGGCGPSNWNYTYYGNLTGKNIVTFSDGNGVQVAHYQIRIIFWMILIDNWGGSDQISANLQGNYSQQMSRNSRLSNQKVCGNGGDNEDYLRFDKTYTHNSSAPYDVNVTTSSSNSKWGIKQFIVLAKLCHVACTACFGALATQCYTCEQQTPMLLSGTTCNQTCLPGYGMKFDGMECVFCDLRCTVCFELSYNCTACKPTGTYASFLLAYNYSCEKNCPIGFYGNYTDRVCYPCDGACVSCKSIPTYCYQCQTSLGYAWRAYTCYNPCPIGTFLSTNLTNCSTCSPFCISCMTTNITCTACTLTGPYTAYLLGTACKQDCGDDFYQDTANGTLNTCKPCDTACRVCTGAPTPCQACHASYWLFDSACGNTCPTEYFKDNVTWSCLLCDTWCVKLTMSMYFPDATNNQIYVDMAWSEDLDFTTFPYTTFQTFTIDSDLYTLDMFNFTYQILSPRAYRIIMEPKGYIFLYNATINCQTMEFPGTYHTSQNGRPFHINDYLVPKSLVWFVIKAPDMTDIEKNIINGLSKFSNQISDFTTKPYVQEIKKSGAFAFLFAGAQITSCSVLVNNIPSQNLYEGVRFWAIFVFFDVPPWEKNSNKTKYVVVPPVSDVIENARMLQQSRRTLFDVNELQWRFLRTGHTSFFIFDTYMVIFLILFCWLLVIIGYCVNKHKPLLFKKHMGKFFTFMHKVHEISILYIMLHTLLEWLYFSTSSLERWLSLGFCILVNIYFLMYELYIYYDMIKYPVAMIGNEKYEYYAIRYGSLLKTIRYEQYDIKEPWSPKQWFRPYNYHILAYYKKLMMIVSLPIFYHTTHAQAAILILLQGAQIARFCFVWPFYKRWRNIYRLILECALQMFFICVMIQGFLVQEIMKNDPDTIMSTIQMFYRFGWIGFGMCFFFNCGFIVLYIYDMYRGCKMSNRQMMDEARRNYYYDKLKAYQQENEDVPLGLVNKWVRLGNLNQRNYDELPDVNIRVEYYRIAKLANGEYEIEVKKLVQLYMNIQFNYAKDNNVNCGKKFNRRFTLTRKLSKDFYYLVDSLYRRYDKYDVQEIIIKTFQKVEQSLFRPGDKVQLSKDRMTQRIILQMHSGHKQTENLDKILQGFPIPIQDLANLS